MSQTYSFTGTVVDVTVESTGDYQITAYGGQAAKVIAAKAARVPRLAERSA